MTAPVLVTGGTGTIGSRAVPMLGTAGQEVRVLSRHLGENGPGITHVRADTVTGEGVAKALDGIEVVLHLAGGAKGDDTAAQNLTDAAKAAGVKHLILISVTGADKMPIGYFHAKAAAEQIVAESGVPYTIIRAAQLHDFVLPVIRAMGRLPLLPKPGGLRFEPVAVEEVARRLCEVTLGHPEGRVADIVGPEVLTVRELADVFYEETRRHRRLSLPVRIPGKIGRAYRAGDNLADDDALRGTGTWREFLAASMGAEV
nr:NAD(P)H-binding protein [Streptomyces xiaopingdaonensis]